MPIDRMIQLSGISKSYRVAPGPGRKAGTVVALRDVTAVVNAGGVTGIAGPNGAGKTTVFGLLLGFLEATAGTVLIDGLDPRAYVRRNGASYLPERFQLPADWTIRAGLIALLSLESGGADVDELLARFDLHAAAGAAAHTLSRGTLQRVGIAQAVARPRQLVVLDEPTEGLDPLWRVHFRELIRELRSPERTILIASHDLAELERMADRVLILNDGTITDTVELRPVAGQPAAYTIVLTAPHDAVAALFPSARHNGEASYTVAVADTRELSARLAALLESGATLVSVTPGSALEPRVTRAVRPEAP